MTIDTCFDEFRKELEEHGRWASERPIRIVRKARGLTHEDFSDISSCTYLSSLERNLKSPTLDKLAQLAAVLQVHPVTLA